MADAKSGTNYNSNSSSKQLRLDKLKKEVVNVHYQVREYILSRYALEKAGKRKIETDANLVTIIETHCKSVEEIEKEIPGSLGELSNEAKTLRELSNRYQKGEPLAKLVKEYFPKADLVMVSIAIGLNSSKK